MDLYLVQHGEAIPKSEDPSRGLSPQGRDVVARMAAVAQNAGVKLYQIRHSKRLRAKETAEIWAEYLAPNFGVAPLSGLAPKDDVRPVAELLSRETRPLMLVGHRPFMERLVGLLVAGEKSLTIVRFQRGTVACLRRDHKTRTWAVHWVLAPDVVPETTSSLTGDVEPMPEEVANIE